MLLIKKADGTEEPFSKTKVISSMQRAGIPPELQPKVLAHIEAKLYPGIPTFKIYKHLTEFLGASENPYHKSRYGLKEGVMALGPTGFPFEKFIARLFAKMGFTTTIDTVLRGICISHEIDVILEKSAHKAMIEAKFHNTPGIKTDVHVALYTKARFDDVKAKHNLDEVYLVTNTKVTEDAIAYSQCMRMNCISWSFPEAGSLRDLIEKYHLHPITMLSNLSNSQKQMLLEKNILLCQELSQTNIHSLGLNSQKETSVLQEAKFVSRQDD